MNIQRSEYSRRDGWLNEHVSKVSDAKERDGIFFANKQELDDLLAKVNDKLAEKELVVVDKFTVTSNGSYRSFIGRRDYKQPTTTIE